MTESRIIFPILPRPWFMFTNQGAIWYIPLDCRSRHRVTGNEEDKGKPCDLYLDGDEYCGHFKEDGKWVGHTLSKKSRQQKDRIEKYNKYRMDLFYMARKLGFQVQAAGMAIYYHIPVPVRWTKKKKAEMHGQMKGSKPDIDNYNKGVFDALTGKDELIGQRAGDGKFWFNPDLVEKKLQGGYIEVLTNQPVYNPHGVTLLNPYQTIEMEDIESRRQKLRARKEELKAEKKKKPAKKVKPLKLISEKRLFKKEDKIK